MNILIALETALARVGWRKTAELKDLRKNIERHLLWEDPKKARELTDDEILTLMSETEPEFAVVNSLLIPFGMRFADAARVRICDVESVQGNVYWYWYWISPRNGTVASVSAGSGSTYDFATRLSGPATRRPAPAIPQPPS
eukprot:PhM_4_TR14691/c3_g5_i6/m.68273